MVNLPEAKAIANQEEHLWIAAGEREQSKKRLQGTKERNTDSLI